MKNKSEVSGTATRTITLEEHFATPAFIEGHARHYKDRPDAEQLVDRLCDLGERRIADMDAAGIDVQVLSLVAPGVEQMDAAEATEMARELNDILADAVQRHPDRFAGFATLAIAAPETAADELERMVREHGFKGGVINGHTRGRYMDDASFWPILERAEALKVPLYIHPARPPQAVVDAYYTGNFPVRLRRVWPQRVGDGTSKPPSMSFASSSAERSISTRVCRLSSDTWAKPFPSCCPDSITS